MKEITIFTVNLIDNGLINTELHQLCINSWYRIVRSAKAQGYKAKIKIFDWNDEDVKYVLKTFADDFRKMKNNTRKSDIVRMYILSQYPNHLYLDWDVYIPDDFEFADIFHFQKSFCFLYNCESIGFFKNIYNAYCEHKIFNMLDRDVANKLGLVNYKSMKGYIHASALDDNTANTPIQFIKPNSDVQIPYIKEILGANDKPKVDRRYIVYICETKHSEYGVFNLRGDKDLIEFAHKEELRRRKENEKTYCTSSTATFTVKRS